jgi:solute carrier family 50 protein (sugar transporter)
MENVLCCLWQVPNGFGCSLGAVQLVLYFIYRDNKGGTKKPTAVESVEMGLPKTHPQEKKSTANGSALQGHD